MKRNKIIICFLVLTLVFTSFINTNFAINLNKNNISNEKPTNDLQEIKQYQLSDSDLEELLNDSNITKDQDVFRAPNLNAYSFNSYGSRYGYLHLANDNMKNAYMAMLSSALNFQNSSSADAQYNESQKIYISNLVNVSSFNLTQSEAFKTYLTMIYDNPQVYYTSSVLFYTSGGSSNISYVALGCDKEYITGSVREQLNTKINQTISVFLDEAAKYKTDAEKELIIHDLLIANLKYAYIDPNANPKVPETARFAHNIVGAFDREHWSVVCEGYAKAFQLILNASGVDCIFVAGNANGGGHAWNQVKLDNEWYNVDITWDDPDNDYIYYMFFNKTDDDFTGEHIAYPSSSTTNMWCYDTNTCNSTRYTQQTVRQMVNENTQLKEITYADGTEDLMMAVLNNGLELISGFKVYKGTEVNTLIISKTSNLAETHYLNVNGQHLYFERYPDMDSGEYYAYISDYYTVEDDDLNFELTEIPASEFDLVLNVTNKTFTAKGSTFVITARVRGTAIDPSKLTFVNDNPYAVKVAADGTVTANSAGISNITVKYEELGKEASCTFNSNFAFTLGDIDNNNRVSILDAYSLLQFLSLRAGGGRIDSSILNAADFDSNGKVSITDAYLLLKYLSENI